MYILFFSRYFWSPFCCGPLAIDTPELSTTILPVSASGVGFGPVPFGIFLHIVYIFLHGGLDYGYNVHA
jgi:hypothetical protein